MLVWETHNCIYCLSTSFLGYQFHEGKDPSFDSPAASTGLGAHPGPVDSDE